MKPNRFYILLTALTLSILACGLPAGGSESQPDGTGNSPSEVKGEPFISAPGVESITLFTDVEGAGSKPLLMWQAVSGASRYQLIVFDEAGEPYWAWEGTETQIYIGGTEAQPPDDSSGPSIEAEYSWAVVAYGADGKVLAASELRPISP